MGCNSVHGRARSGRIPSVFALVSWILVALLAGCGGESFPIAPVSGTVTLDGQPLQGARVGFEPRRQGENLNAGPGSYALTDAQGHFELETVTGQPGAVVGPHDVWIRTFQAAPDRTASAPVIVQEKVPAKYNDESTLTFDVPSTGTGAADFDLSTDD